MSRAHFYRPVQDERGDLKGTLSVRLLEPGTTTQITEDIHTTSDGPTIRGNPWTAPDSVVDFYLDTPRVVRIGITPEGAQETYFEDMEVGSVSLTDAAIGLAVDSRTDNYLVQPTGTDAANVATLNDAIARAAADQRGLSVRGTFSINDYILLPANTYLDLTGAVITQTADLKSILRVTGDTVTIRGGVLNCKQTDFVNSSSVYAASAIRMMAGAANVTVEGVTVVKCAGAGIEVNVGVLGQVIIRDNVMTGPGFGYLLTISYGTPAGIRLLSRDARMIVENNDVSAFGQGLICAEGTVNLRIAGNNFHDNSQHGAYTQTADSMVFTNNVMRNNRVCGMKQTVEKPNPGIDGYACLIADNVAKNNGAQGYLLTNPSIADVSVPLAMAARLRGFRIQDNVADGNQHGIEINPGCVDLAIVGNTIRNTPVASVPARAISTDYVVGQMVSNVGRIYKCSIAGTTGTGAGPTGASGTMVDGTSSWTYFGAHGITVSGLVNGEINGNRVYGTHDQGIDLVDCTRVKVHDNEVRDCTQGHGLTNYGIDVSGASVDIEVSKNRVSDVLGNMKYGINIRPTDQSTYFVYDNSGSGATDYGISTLGTSMRAWRDNAVDGALGRVLLPPAARSYYEAEDYKTATNTDLDAIKAACAAASLNPNAKGASVRLSPRVWDVGNGLSMSGYNCGLVGMGCGYYTSGNFGLTGSVLWASTQVGAVLDMSGWLSPSSFRGAVEFGKFGIKGNNVADPTKANAGIKNSGAAHAGMWWHDIVIDMTGGPCVDYKNFYVSVMERVTCCTPVGAKANDVPYMIQRGNNGSTFNSIGFRSMLSTADTGPGGALVVTDDGVSAASNSKWNSTWFEFLHLPSNGCFIDTAGNNHQFAGTYFTDEGIEAGATNTYYVRFSNVVNGANYGGQSWRGLVPGNGGSVGFTGGMKVSQKATRIEGLKAFNGANVTIDSGVTGCYVSLGASIQGVQGGPSAFIDNSGNTTNTLLDFYNYPNTGLPGPGNLTYSITSTSTVTVNTDLYTRAKVLAQTGALAVANPTGTPISMQGLIYRIKDNGTARALSYGTQFRAVGVILPSTTVPNKTLYLGCIWNTEDSKWDVIAVSQEV